MKLTQRNVFEVEFLGSNGKTVALGEFHRNELLLLLHEAMLAA